MKILDYIQNILIKSGLFLLVCIPLVSFFVDLGMPIKTFLFSVSFLTAFLIIIVRPLADIFAGIPFLRRLVILRKGLGILSASIIVGFMLEKIITPGSTYLASMFYSGSYSFNDYAIFARSGDISGFILLITSNQLSQRILKGNWKLIQQLAYVYFYSGGIYEAFFLNNIYAAYALFVATDLLVFAWIWKKLFHKQEQKVVLTEQWTPSKYINRYQTPGQNPGPYGFRPAKAGRGVEPL